MRRVGRRLGIDDVAPYDPDESRGTATVLLLRADTVIEDRIVPQLFRRAPVVLNAGPRDAPGRAVAVCAPAAALPVAAAVAGSGAAPPADWTRLTAAADELSYNEVLRKRAVPFVIDLETTPARELEWRMFGASYKGATDFVTKWLWPRPAFHVTRFCAAHGITPNQVTALSGVFVLAAMALFWWGHFGPGLAFAWAMTFLDTVDGKLARVTVTSSKWGNVFDHGIDMIHPPFWYWAWWQGLTALGLQASPALAWFGLEAALAVIVIGYVAGRLQEGAFIALYKFEMHVWRPFDFWFRAITARRNPNLAILTVGTLAGAPAEAFILVALWTLIGLGVHGVRLIQAMAARGRGQAVESFLSEPSPAGRAA